MATVREERAARIRKRVGEGLADNLGHVLPLLLDDLDAIARREVADGIEEFMKGFNLAASFTPEEHDEIAREVFLDTPTEQPAAPVKPATRRRTARKDGDS